MAKAIEDKALAAKQSAVPKPDNDSTIKCEFCRRGPHDTDKCPFRKAFNEVIEALARKNIRRQYRGKRDYPKKAMHKADYPDRYNRYNRAKRPDRKDKKPWSERREHGHAADEESSTDNYSTTDSSDSDDSVEHAHLTRDEIRKVPHSYWCSDSCASSHMTDDKSLFRSPLIPIRQRTILVGGGQLYANWMGTAELQVKGSSSILISDVLYILHLGINLLSSKKLCSKGLTFTGDNHTIAFWRN